MKYIRSLYFWITLFILFFGIVSRQIKWIPYFFGDILYACLIYFGLRFIFPQFKLINTTVLTFLFCVIIEISQLYQANWIVSIRSTTLGHYVLGQGFLWSDLICYSFGCIISIIIDLKISAKTQNSWL